MNRRCLLLAVALLHALSEAIVPDRYLGTWILDEEASEP